MEKLQKILIEFEDLINQQTGIDDILEKAEVLKLSFISEIELINKEKLEEFIIDGGEEGNFIATKLAEEAKYNDLLFIINDRKQKKEEAVALEYAENLKLKKAIISQLRNLIENEEHIGKAFENFNEIREQWKLIGNVSSHEYKPLQAEYSNLLEAFFYNINIYKELKEHDLKRNLQLRLDLIEKMEALISEKQIKLAQSLSGTYLSEWDEIGPVHKDDWTKISDKFKTVTKKVFTRIKDHFNDLKNQREKNLELKLALIGKTEEIVNSENSKEKNWKKNTDQIIEIQKEWKKIGFASKKENDKVWNEFRTLCDKFFEEKGKFFEGTKVKWNENKDQKIALIKKAEELKNSTDWQTTSNELIQLQNAWKKVGPCNQKNEQQLWKQFREACDYFFNAKKEFIDTLDDRLEANLKVKEEFIKMLSTIKLEGNKEKDRATIKQLMGEWNKLGQVPPKDFKNINASFNSAIDGLYTQMGEDNVVELLKFQDKIESISNRENADRLLLEEAQFLSSKIEVLNKEKLQYENNLLFFGFSKGAAADKMRADVHKQIATVDAQILEWDKKLRLVTKMRREVEKSKA